MLCVLLGISTTANAGPATAEVAALNDDNLKIEYNRAVRRATDMESCDPVPYADELEKRGLYPSLTGVFALIRAGCARTRGDAAGALREAEKAEQAGVPSLGTRGATYIDWLALLYAASERDGAVFERHATHIASRDQPGEFAAVPVEVFGYGFNQASTEQSERVALAFARANSFASLDAELRQGIAARAIKPAIAAKDEVTVEKLLAALTDSESILAMLTNRDYEPIWPMLAKRAGPRGASVRADEIRGYRALIAGDDQEPMRKKMLLQAALVANGQFSEAIAIAQEVDHSPAGFAKLTQEQAWLINGEVAPLDLLGRRAEADVLADRLVSEPVDKGSMISFTLNRIGRLQAHGEWQKSLADTDSAVELSRTQGNPYSQNLARGVRACALYKTRSKRDFAPDRDAVYKDWQAAVNGSVQLALCLDDKPAALRFLREGLKNEETRERSIRILQPRGAFSFIDPADVEGVPHDLLAADAELKSLYDQYARDLPEEFWTEPQKPAG